MPECSVQPRNCFPWPVRTIVVLVIILIFIVAMVAIGAPPLIAIGGMIAAAVIAVTGDVPAAIPGL
jgi:hypothetical protein